jgi:regulator of sigma E protease
MHPQTAALRFILMWYNIFAPSFKERKFVVNTFVSGGLNLIIFIVILGILVFVHELGHFAVAKRLGIPVFEFGFGFPPRLKRFWRDEGWIEIQGKRIVIPRRLQVPANVTIGARVRYKTELQNGHETLTALQVVDPASPEASFSSVVQGYDPGTEYTLNAVPLGGFVRLMGEEDPNVPGGFAIAKPSVRTPILLAGVTMNLLLAFVVFSITAFFTPPYEVVQTTRIIGVTENSPAALAGLRANDHIVAINGQDMRDNYPLLSQTLRQNAGREVTLSIVRNGQPLAPITVIPRTHPPRGEGPLGIQLGGWLGLRVTSVEAGSPADRAGVRAGDVLVFLVDPKGRTLKDQNELAEFTQSHLGWKIEWRVYRNNQLSDPMVVQIPEQLTPAQATLGLNLKTSLVDAPIQAVQGMWTIVASIPATFAQIFAGNAPANALVGPLGIYQITGEVAQRGGPLALLELLGLLSLNLAFVNILPLPALDGGRLVFVLLEWVRGGKRIDPRKEGMVHLIGIALLLGLMVLISIFDVQRMIAGQPILPTP